MQYEAENIFGEPYWLDVTLVWLNPVPIKEVTSYKPKGWKVEFKGYRNDDPEKSRFYRTERFQTKRDAQAFLDWLKTALLKN